MANIQPSTSSGDIAVGTLPILSGPGRLKGMSIWGGSAASSIIVYDNATAASGTVLMRLSVAANTTWAADFSEGIICNNGLTAVVAGTAAIGTVYYDKG